MVCRATLTAGAAHTKKKSNPAPVAKPPLSAYNSAAEAPSSVPIAKKTKDGPSLTKCMPYRKEEFISGEIYHIILRGVDDNIIFKDIDDYYRGIFSIYEFNNFNPVDIRLRREIRNRLKKNEGPSFVMMDDRDKLVEILAFCFMPNHIHLLVRQIKDRGITKFMAKVGTGYASYFNKKYGRKGYVFQNRFKSVHIADDNQLMTVVNYIHTNPISLIEPKFKEEGIKNHSTEEVLEFLKNGYRWSSFPDYVGLKNFPSVTERDFIVNAMDGEKNVANMLMDWILHKKWLANHEGMLD